MNKQNIFPTCLIPMVVAAALFTGGCESDNSQTKEPPLEMPPPLGSESRVFQDMQIRKAKESATTQSRPAEEEIEVYEDMRDSRTN